MQWDLEEKHCLECEIDSEVSCDKAVMIFFFLSSLKENRPLSKAFFTRMIEIEKEQVRSAQLLLGQDLGGEHIILTLNVSEDLKKELRRQMVDLG